MSNVKKPVVLLVHGAWHRPLHYRLLINRLREQGFTVLAPPLATSGCDDSIAEKTQRDDVHRIHEVLLPYLDSGRQAIVVAHSYGGVPATEAVEGHTVAERTARGEKGGITAVIYISAILAMQTGESVIGAAGGEYQTLRFHGLDVSFPRDLIYLEVILNDGAHRSSLYHLRGPRLSLRSFMMWTRMSGPRP